MDNVSLTRPIITFQEKTPYCATRPPEKNNLKKKNKKDEGLKTPTRMLEPIPCPARLTFRNRKSPVHMA